MPGNVSVIVEQWRGQVTEISYELLALGRELADQSLAPLQAVLFGYNSRDMTRTLGCADSVLYLDHPSLEDPLPETCAEALAGFFGEQRTQCVLCPLTNNSLGLGALLADRLGAPSVSLCKDVRVAADYYEATCLLYGGKIEAVVRVDARPAIFSVRPGTRPGHKGRSDRHPPVAEEKIDLPVRSAVQLKGYVSSETGDVDITRSEVLVAVGRGLQGPENLPLAEHLAESLHGAVCGSRPPVDQGWLPLSRQVGCSGLSVRPKLYIALGISGTPEHTEGMRDSEVILAVNTDPDAPIFDFAQYGVVADALEFLPVLTGAIESAKSDRPA